MNVCCCSKSMTSSSSLGEQPALSNHSLTLFRSRCGAALRTAIACTIVGVASVYFPPSVRHLIKFPASSYVFAVQIVDDATLGDTLKCTFLIAYATILSILPAMLMSLVIRPVGMTALMASVGAAVSAFVVVMLGPPALVTKRIALAQIVLIYVASFDFKQPQPRPVMHPIPVLATTVVGVAAAVLALLVPYPRLAFYEVGEKGKLYTEIAIERLRLFVNALCADNVYSMAASISLAKSLGHTCSKLLRSVRVLQKTMIWERPPLKFLPPYLKKPSERLEEVEISLKGMEMAISSITSSPLRIIDQLHLKEDILNLQDSMSTKIKSAINSKAKKDYTMDTTLQHLLDIPQKAQDLPPFFFIFCMKLLFEETLIAPPPSPQEENKIGPTTEQNVDSCKGGGDKEEENEQKGKRPNFIAKKIITRMQGICAMNLSAKKFVVALKCSLTLGLSIFLGLLFSKENGYWAGLTVAATFAPSGQATFHLASLRIHGTAIGSIFGILGALVSQNLMGIRFLLLVPWVIFTSFLQRSQMYGQPGAISAVLSAVIIIGRKDYGSPIMFTIQRLVETYIAICVAVVIELLLQPSRASTLARSRLEKSLETLHQCVDSVTIVGELKEKEKKLEKLLKELKGYIGEAELEPNFWFLPFSGSCYNKLHCSLVKTEDLLVFLVRSMEVLGHECYEIEENMKGDLDEFKRIAGGLVEFLEEVIQVKSLQNLKKDLEGKVHCDDLEGQRSCENWALINRSTKECEKVVTSFLRHSREAVEGVDEDGVGDSKDQLVLCFATIGYCIGGLMREVKEMEKEILELMQRENPSSHINLYEFFCKIRNAST